MYIHKYFLQTPSLECKYQIRKSQKQPTKTCTISNTASITQIFKCFDSTTYRRAIETGYLQNHQQKTEKGKYMQYEIITNQPQSSPS
jgi:hypothetical protein